MASIDELTDELLRYQRQNPDPGDDRGYPTKENIDELISNQPVGNINQDQRQVLDTMTGKLSAESQGDFGALSGLMNAAEDVTEHFVDESQPGNASKNMVAPVDPTLAAQAAAAAVSALSNPSLIAPGLHVQGNLNATVYDRVDLTFESAYLKNNLDETTYTHTADVTINAKHVRLTAPELKIDTTKEERNTVYVSKVSKRAVNVGFGVYSTLSTPVSNTAVTALNFEPSGVSNSAVVNRIAAVGVHYNQARLRVGAKGMNVAIKPSVSIDFAEARRSHRIALLRIIL